MKNDRGNLPKERRGTCRGYRQRVFWEKKHEYRQGKLAEFSGNRWRETIEKQDREIERKNKKKRFAHEIKTVRESFFVAMYSLGFDEIKRENKADRACGTLVK